MILSPTVGTWRRVRVTAVGTPATMGIAECVWAGHRSPDLVIQIEVSEPADTANVRVGSSVRAFRQVTYGEYLDQGRWWLGKKAGSWNSAAAYEKLTGPLIDSTLNGLRFDYYSATGAVATKPSDVAIVKLAIRSQSYKRYRTRGGVPVFRYDSLITKIALRK